jgi:hypothetical protein
MLVLLFSEHAGSMSTSKTKSKGICVSRQAYGLTVGEGTDGAAAGGGVVAGADGVTAGEGAGAGGSTAGRVRSSH